jgi:NADPH:quinone reductase-like Zn-dependent oxidoreductase
MPVPEGLALEDAAAVPEVFLTAWDALVWQGGLTSGGRALVHAGASGVGTASIQLAKAIGARIAVTASTSKVAACEDLGADLVVDYTKDAFDEKVLEWAPDGVDVVLDVIGGDYVNKNLACTKITGRIIQVGLMGSGRIEDFDLGMLLQRRIALVGTLLRPRTLEAKITATQRFAAEVLPRFTDGSLKPIIDSRHPLAEASKAHERMQQNANVGKLLLDVRESVR